MIKFDATEPRVAAVLVGGDRTTVHASRPAEVRPDLERLGYSPTTGPGTFAGPTGDAEPLMALLDRRGFVWAQGPTIVPRTWAERFLAEIPVDHHRRLVALLDAALVDLPDHRALLALAARAAP